MLSKFIILALTEESLAVILQRNILKQKDSDSKVDSAYSSDGETGAGKKKQIAWSCKRNECRSAGAMIISTVITKCFDDFKNKFELSSFGAEEGDGIEYGLGATPTLVQAFQKNYKEYLQLAIEELGYAPSTAEQDCFKREMRDESESFKSTAPSDKQICKEHMTVYAANSGVVELIKKKTGKKCAGNEIPKNLDVMKKDGVADGPWHANAMFERLALVKLLEAYPGHYEEGKAPFTRDTGILEGAQLDIYQKTSDGKPPAGTDTIKYPGDENKQLHPKDIGFLWHDLVVFGDDKANIAPEFATMITNFEKNNEVGWNISGAIMKNGVYGQSVIVRPPFFNRGELKKWLREDGKTELAKEIEDAEVAISFKAYDELVKTLLPAVIAKLNTNLDSRSHAAPIGSH